MFDRVSAWVTQDLTKDQLQGVSKVSWRLALAVFIAYAMGWAGPLGFSGFARAADLDKVSADQIQHVADLGAKIASVNSKLDRFQVNQQRAEYEARLRQLDQDIFSIEARLAEITRLGQVADAIYSQRLSELRNERGEVVRLYEAFLRVHPEALSGGGG